MKKRIFLSMLLLVGAMAASVGEANAQSSTSQDVPNVVHGKSDGTPSKKNEIYYSDYVYFKGKVDKKTKTPSGKGDLVILQKQAKYTSNFFDWSVAYYVNGIFNGNQVTNAHLHIPGGYDFNGDLSYEVYGDIVKFKLLNGKLGTVTAKDNEYVVNINDYSFSTDMDIYVLQTSDKPVEVLDRRDYSVRRSDGTTISKPVRVPDFLRPLFDYHESCFVYDVLEFDTVSVSGVNIIKWKYKPYVYPFYFVLAKNKTNIELTNTRKIFNVGGSFWYYEDSQNNEIITDFNGNYLKRDTINLNIPSFGLVRGKIKNMNYKHIDIEPFAEMKDSVYNIDGKPYHICDADFFDSFNKNTILKDLNGKTFGIGCIPLDSKFLGVSEINLLNESEHAFDLFKFKIDRTCNFVCYNSAEDLLEGKWAGGYSDNGKKFTRDKALAYIAEEVEKSNARITEKQAKEKEKEAEYKKHCQKWGKANVDLIKYAGEVKVGMPVELLKEYCKMGCAYESGNVARWEVYTLPHDKAIFTLDSRYDGYHLSVWTRNGKVTSISYK